MAEGDHPRLLLRRFLSADLCKELEFIHLSCSTIGYRPNVFSTTLSHLIATDCGHLILPFLTARDRIKEKVEEFFGCEFELFVEFTGLISWCRGGCIGWHSDDNRPYLKQRDFAAVCYLNSHGKDFKGGIFHFKDGKPSSVTPEIGDVLIYTADSRNIHSVDEVLDGERITLTLWFTRNNDHDEDARLISLLTHRVSNHELERSKFCLPTLASDNMYWFSDNEFGFDIRYERMRTLGFQLYSSQNGTDSDLAPLELLQRPVRLARGDEIFDKEFANVLHALQVVQFYYWKAPLLAETSKLSGQELRRSRQLVSKKVNELELLLPSDDQLVKRVLSGVSSDMSHLSFSWDCFALAIEMWEDHVNSLHSNSLALMAYWVSHHILFFANTSELHEWTEKANSGSR